MVGKSLYMKLSAFISKLRKSNYTCDFQGCSTGLKPWEDTQSFSPHVIQDCDVSCITPVATWYSCMIIYHVS